MGVRREAFAFGVVYSRHSVGATVCRCTELARESRSTRAASRSIRCASVQAREEFTERVDELIRLDCHPRTVTNDGLANDARRLPVAYGKAYATDLRVLYVVDAQTGSNTGCRVQLACRARVDTTPVVQAELLILWNEAVGVGTERRRGQARDFALAGLDNERALNHRAVPTAVL